MLTLSPQQFAPWLHLLPVTEPDADAGLIVIEADASVRNAKLPRFADTRVIVVVDRAGELPFGFESAADVMLTTSVAAPAPWVTVQAAELDHALRGLERTLLQTPATAAVLCQVLRAGEGLSFEQALLLESFAFSMLLAGPEFKAWRSRNPARKPGAPGQVSISRRGEELCISLRRPWTHNALCTRMRSTLAEALRVAVVDESLLVVTLQGEGSSFCSGGDLDEFGTAPDPVTAHAVRMEQSASRLIAQLGSRTQALLHGACVGAGLEIASACGRVVARHDTSFRLPETQMGLIPGAGGTASIPRRIGRHRTAWMALTGASVGLNLAVQWGLVDELTTT